MKFDKLQQSKYFQNSKRIQWMGENVIKDCNKSRSYVAKISQLAQITQMVEDNQTTVRQLKKCD